MPWRNCGLSLNHGPPLKATFWEPGNPLLDQGILGLIERYVASAGQLPEWVQYLRAHRAEAKQEENGAPKEKAHREEAGQKKEEEDINPFVSGGCNQMAEPQHPHMATLIRATKAILAYVAVNWPGVKMT